MTVAPRIFHHFAEYHRPRFYRYRVADPGIRMMRNVYPSTPTHPGETHVGTAWIGLCLVVGRYAYCVKWANAGIRIEREADQ